MTESIAETVHIFTKFLWTFKRYQTKTWWNRRSMLNLYPPPGNLLIRHSMSPQHCSYRVFPSQIYSQLCQVFLPVFVLEVVGLLGDLLTLGTSPRMNPVYRLCGQFWTVNIVRFDLLITCLSVYCLLYCPLTLFCLFKNGDVTKLWCHRPSGLAQ